MRYLVDTKNKVIFGWSAKCGCSHIKKLFWYLQNVNVNILHRNDRHKLPTDMHNYTTIVITRNPYERLVSGFLHKYNKKGECRKNWPYNEITFAKFVEHLTEPNWKICDIHHFIPQTSEEFDYDQLSLSKKLNFYDIKNIDYEYIGNLYDKIIPNNIKEFRGNEYKGTKDILDTVLNNKITNINDINDISNLNMDNYYGCKLPVYLFYNEEIKNKIYKFYLKDFELFQQFNYNNL